MGGYYWSIGSASGHTTEGNLSLYIPSNHLPLRVPREGVGPHAPSLCVAQAGLELPDSSSPALASRVAIVGTAGTDWDAWLCLLT